MIRVLCCLFLLFSFQSAQSCQKTSKPKPPYAAFIMHAETGKTLYQVNPDTPVYPASLTKMMTLYLTFKALDKGKVRLWDPVYISHHAASQEPSKLGLPVGKSLSVKQAILALVTKSANDVAVALAQKIGGSERAFACAMSKEARLLGLKNTTFRNASGLFHVEQKTTARDMARLGRALLKHFPRKYKFFNTPHFSFQGKTHKNHNKLLGSLGSIQVDGIKTGYIGRAGFNLVASAKRYGKRLIAVVIGADTGAERDKHMENLILAAYETHGLLRSPQPSFQKRPKRRTSEPRIYDLLKIFDKV